MVKNTVQHCSFCFNSTLTRRGVGLVAGSVLVFAGIELWVGWLSHSLTLRADSGHMLADGLAMGIALGAALLAQRSPTPASRPHLAELLSAAINGLALLAMAAWIGREAWSHWHNQPTEILSTPMLITALLGLLINSLNLYWLHDGVQQNLNVRGMFLHILADLLGSLGAVLAAIAVTFWQWSWADIAIGTVVAVVIAVSAIPLLWQSLRTWRELSKPAPLMEKAALYDYGWLETGQADLRRLISPESVSPFDRSK